MTLVLSLFPGIGLLDRAFEAEGFCVVRGPDLLWGGDIHTFHPPAGVFDGIIGGPPCQAFSRLVSIVKAKGLTPKPNLIPEFERCIEEAMPQWFLMENVPEAPIPQPKYYWPARALLLNNRMVGAEQNRQRRFSFGTSDRMAEPMRLDVSPDLVLFEDMRYERAVMASSSKEAGGPVKSQMELRTGTSPRVRREGASLLPGGMPRRSLALCCELQGLPPDFLDYSPLTMAGKYQAVGNGVPLQMGGAVARAVKRALA